MILQSSTSVCISTDTKIKLAVDMDTNHVARFFFGWMMDVASKNLNHILKNGEFVLFEKAIPLFDEHNEFDKSGKLVRKFGLDELKTIARNCNNRANTTGDLAPWGPGHTRDDVETEDEQPPIRGYYHNYRVAKYGPSGKLAVVADCYVQKEVEVTTKNGKKLVDGREYAKGLPRRSVELWPNSMTIDWVAHLRRSPMRDLGLATYSRDSYEILYSPGRIMIAATMRGSNKLRYQMETDMAPEEDEKTVEKGGNPNGITPADDPTTAPADEMEPEGHEDFVKHLEHSLKNHPVMKYMHACAKKYGASMASPTNAAPPGAKPAPGSEEPEEEVPAKFSAEHEVPGDQPITPVKKLGDGEALKNMKQERGVQVSRYQRELDDIRGELAASKQKEKIARFERDFNEMVHQEGIEMDVADELLDCATMTDEQFNARKEKIRKNYQRSPVGRLPQGMLPTETIGDPLVQHADEITRYAREKNLPATHGADAFFEAARQLKYVK